MDSHNVPHFQHMRARTRVCVSKTPDPCLPSFHLNSLMESQVFVFLFSILRVAREGVIGLTLCKPQGLEKAPEIIQKGLLCAACLCTM